MEEGRREYCVYILPAPSWPLGTTGSPQSEMEEPGRVSAGPWASSPARQCPLPRARGAEERAGLLLVTHAEATAHPDSPAAPSQNGWPPGGEATVTNARGVLRWTGAGLGGGLGFPGAAAAAPFNSGRGRERAVLITVRSHCKESPPAAGPPRPPGPRAQRLHIF